MPSQSAAAAVTRFVRRVPSLMSKTNVTAVSIATFVAGLLIGFLGLIAFVAYLGSFVGEPLASLKQTQFPESHAEALKKVVVIRELMFYSDLQKQTGIVDQKGGMGIRFESPDAVSKRFWTNLLGYGDGDAQVTILSNLYRTHDHIAEAFPDEATPDVDEKRVDLGNSRTIVEPTYGAPPLRSFSGLAQVSPKSGHDFFIRFELAYVWVDNRWHELVRSVTELPSQEHGNAWNADLDEAPAP